jgi:hypothetical protein
MVRMGLSGCCGFNRYNVGQKPRERFAFLRGNSKVFGFVLPRVELYDVIYKTLVRRVELFDASASISMEELRMGMAVPLGCAV